MKKMFLMVLLLVMSNSGCLSYMTYKDSQEKVALRKALLNNDQNAIRAVRLGDNGVGVGIDVSSWEALSEQPLKQLFSAAGDAGMIYGGYKGVESLNNSDGGSDNGGGNNTSGRDTVVVNGDGNSINTSAPVTTSSGAGPATTE